MPKKIDDNKNKQIKDLIIDLAIRALNDAMSEHKFVPVMVEIFTKSFIFYLKRKLRNRKF